MPGWLRNARERRPRAGWRFVAQSALLIALLAALGALAATLDEPASERLAWAAQVVAPIASVLLVARFVDRRRLRDLGLRVSPRWVLDYAAGWVIGALLIAVIVLLGWAAGIARVDAVHADPGIWLALALPSLARVVIDAFSEELWFRGYLTKNFAEGTSRLGARRAMATACVLSSVLFGLAHVDGANATPMAVVGLVAVGLLFAFAYARTGQLGLPAGLHAAWNFTQGRLFGLSVSGHEARDALIGIRQHGPELLTGGAFGPEAGLPCLAACVVGVGAVAAYAKLARHRPDLDALVRPELRVEPRA